MYKHILVALDGRPASEQALKQALALARLTGASLTGISVIEKLPAYAASVGEVQEAKEEFERFFEKIHTRAVKVAEAAGIALKTAIRAGNAAQKIIQYAVENEVDLIVVGVDGQEKLGNTADKVTEHAACSVLIARISLPSMKVKEAMTRNVAVVHPATPLSKVVETLIEKGLKAVPVVEEGQLRGIITGGDLLARSGMGLRLSLQRTLPPHVFAEQIRQLDAEGKTAKDIMSSPVITVSEDDHITNAVALMTEKGIKRIPVVNHQGELVGILSRLDILALVSSSSPSADFFPSASGASARTAGDVMFRDVPTVDPECPLNDVVTQILSTPLRRVVVVDEEHHILGIIVDRDLVKAFPHGKTGGLTNILSHLSSKPQGILNLTGSAADVMNKDVFSVRPDTPLAAVVQTMIDKRIKRLTVADEDNRLVGMVSRESILHTFG